MSSCVRLRIRLTDQNRRAWMTLGLYSAGLLLAWFAQRVLYEGDQPLAGTLVYIGALIFLGAAWSRHGEALILPLPVPPAAPPVPSPAHPARKLFVLPGWLFAVIAFLELGDNTFTLLGTTAWLTALVLFLVAFWEGSIWNLWDGVRSRWQELWQRDPAGRRARWVALALTGIFVLGLFFYFYRLDAIPAEMTSDHAEKILDTYDILNGKYSIFFERNTGREPLQFYMNALVVALGLAPLDMLALKTVGALAGVLTIPAVFLLARELFDDEVGLYAAFFFAVSIFPLAIARIGLRYPLAPLFVAWTCYFLLRALRRQSRNDYLMAGLMLGLGLNGYSPFRVVVVLVLVWLVCWLIFKSRRRTGELARVYANSLLLFAATLLVFVPLLRYLSEHPANFSYRMATRLTSLEHPVEGNPLVIFLDNNLRAAGMFNLRGDVVWVNSVPNVPSVDWLIGACFLVGVLYALYRTVRAGEYYPYAWLVLALFILFLPSTLALAFPDENPSVVRAGGAAPIVMVLAALPLAQWRRQFVPLGSRGLGFGAVLLVLGGIVLLNYNLYFFRYDDQYRRAAWNSTEIASTLRAFAQAHNDWEHIYVLSEPYWVDYRAVGIHLGNYNFRDHLVETLDQLRIQAEDPAPKLYALTDQDPETLNLLKALYPSGTVEQINARTPGRDFIVFYAPTRSGG